MSEPIFKDLRVAFATASTLVFAWDVEANGQLESQDFWQYSWLEKQIRHGAKLGPEARGLTITGLEPDTRYGFTLAGHSHGKLIDNFLFLQDAKTTAAKPV